MFDLEGCGIETRSAQEIENEMENDLKNHWGERGAVIVIAPEMDIWVWSDSPHVDEILGWSGREPDLRSWLTEQGYKLPEQEKPIRPKEALEKALYVTRKPRSLRFTRRWPKKSALHDAEIGLS